MRPLVLAWDVLQVCCVCVWPWSPDLWTDFQACHQTSSDWIFLAVTGMCLTLVTIIRPKLDAGWLPSFTLDLLHEPQTCLMIWTWMNLAAIPGPALHASLGYRGTELWLARSLPWWMCYCAWLPAPSPLENHRPSTLFLLALLHTGFFSLADPFLLSSYSVSPFPACYDA